MSFDYPKGRLSILFALNDYPSAPIFCFLHVNMKSSFSLSLFHHISQKLCSCTIFIFNIVVLVLDFIISNITFCDFSINLFQPNVPCLYPLKTSKKPKVFLMFSCGIEMKYWPKRVKKISFSLSKFTYTFLLVNINNLPRFLSTGTLGDVRTGYY